jgi:peptide/nickel transport system substrate-binding protein
MLLMASSCGAPAQTGEKPAQEIKGQVTQPEQTKTAEPTAQSKTPTAPVAAAKPLYGGTLRAVWSSTEPQSWDPADAMWYTNPVTSFYFETLLIGDLEKGPRGTNETGFGSFDWVADEHTTGMLAETWELPDPLTIIFRLRKGILWQEKRPVMSSRELVAQDVVYSYVRYANDPRRTVSARPWIDSNKVTAPDKYTVMVKTNYFNGDWMNALGWGYYRQVYPKELVDAGIKDWRNAVGTGPFILTDYVTASSLSFVKNPNYWGTTVIGGTTYKLPFADRFEWPIIPDESTRLAALKTGKVDHVLSTSWKYETTLDKEAPTLIKKWMPAVSFPMMGFRTDKAPFTDIRVRQALNMAIDRKAMIDSLSGGHGAILNAPFSILWPESLYTPLEKLPPSAQQLFEYNPDKAKKLLAEAGYPNGFKTTIDTNNVAAAIDRNSMVAAYWKAIGVEAELKPREYATLLSIMMGHKQEGILETGKAHGTPISILSIMGEDGVWNAAVYWPTEFKDKRIAAGETFDMVERNRRLKELNVELINSAAYVWLPTADSINYWWPWVKNYYGEYSVGAAIPAPYYARMWLDLDLRQQMTGRR